ncbi:MAG: hypothetical protein WD993_04540 [Thermoleophilaceae bacterium]
MAGSLSAMADWTAELDVFCADTGSLKLGNFAWARRIPDAAVEVHPHADIAALVDAVAEVLAAGRPVALGFEAPMFVPVPEDPAQLAKARPCDAGAAAWCSPPGGAVLTQALAQVPWILERTHDRVPDTEVHFSWEPFSAAQRGLLLWEAFVSGNAKGETHVEDAENAITAFCAQLPEVGDAIANETQRPFSFVAAAAQWAGFDIVADELRGPCVLVRAPDIDAEPATS